jgi:hypothetical protein
MSTKGITHNILVAGTRSGTFRLNSGDDLTRLVTFTKGSRLVTVSAGTQNAVLFLDGDVRLGATLPVRWPEGGKGNPAGLYGLGPITRIERVQPATTARKHLP